MGKFSLGEKNPAPTKVFDRPAMASESLYMAEVGDHNVPKYSERRVIWEHLFTGLDLCCPDRLDNPPHDGFIMPDDCAVIAKVIASYCYKLVIKIANRYSNQGLPLSDLIQEGNCGLMRAIWKFDLSRGTDLSTYAVPWIRQGISRALADQSRSIRVPVHMSDSWKRMKKVMATLTAELHRLPTEAEIAKAMGKSVAQIRETKMLMRRVDTASLDAKVGEDDEKDADAYYHFFDDPSQQVDQIVERKERNNLVAQLLETLTPREYKILSLRYGLNGNNPHTLEIVGQKFGLTRERIRQVEHQALAKLRENPNTALMLGEYINS